jgi:hypothetical protein
MVGTFAGGDCRRGRGFLAVTMRVVMRASSKLRAVFRDPHVTMLVNLQGSDVLTPKFFDFDIIAVHPIVAPAMSGMFP